MPANFPIMRPYDYQESKLYPSCIITPKIDGLRVHLYDGQLWTREGKLIRGMRAQLDALGRSQRRFPHVDCEADIPGMDFDSVSGIIRAHSHPLKVRVVLNVIDLPCVQQDLSSRLSFAHHYFKGHSPFWEAIPYHFAHTTEEVDMWYHIYLNRGYEGIVVKNPWSPYINCGNTRRSWEWMRRKPELTFDGILIDVVEGKGKYESNLGALIVERISTQEQIKVGGGKLKDQERAAIFKNPDRYRGRRCEIVYQRRTAAGGYRHPRFRRFRPIK